MPPSTSASGAAPTTPVNLARSLSLKTTSVPTKPSNVTLFITNLRLLDLDLRPDWPSITTQTFSTQNAQQNQKNRIRSIEWALFRLFELWDVEETRDVRYKLRLMLTQTDVVLCRNSSLSFHLSNPFNP